MTSFHHPSVVLRTLAQPARTDVARTVLRIARASLESRHLSGRTRVSNARIGRYGSRTTLTSSKRTLPDVRPYSTRTRGALAVRLARGRGLRAALEAVRSGANFQRARLDRAVGVRDAQLDQIAPACVRGLHRRAARAQRETSPALPARSMVCNTCVRAPPPSSSTAQLLSSQNSPSSGSTRLRVFQRSGRSGSLRFCSKSPFATSSRQQARPGGTERNP